MIASAITPSFVEWIGTAIDDMPRRYSSCCDANPRRRASSTISVIGIVAPERRTSSTASSAQKAIKTRPEADVSSGIRVPVLMSALSARSEATRWMIIAES